MSNAAAYGDNLLVEIEQTATQSGLIIAPSRNEDEISTATVLSKGLGVSVGLNSGDKILFSRMSGLKLSPKSNKYFIKEANVLAVITEE